MNRREFIAMSGAAVLAPRTSLMQTDDVRLRRVCVSSWSFHTFFEIDRDNPAKVLMDVRDFPGMVADQYHVHNVEIILPHFLSAEPSLVREFKERLARAHSRLVNMPLDFGVLWNKPAISSTDAAERDAAIALYKKGIDTAHALGSPSVRCDPGLVNLVDPAVTVDAYRQLAAYANAKGIKVVVENHGEISRNPDVLTAILKAAGVGALPDFGNFPDEATRERGLRALFPLAGEVAHAKLREGQDFARCMRIAAESGFKGVFSIEAGGPGDPYAEVQTIVDALVGNL
ncbi:MAG: TIM barrel protein [Vicinamibacterales bacterium]